MSTVFKIIFILTILWKPCYSQDTVCIVKSYSFDYIDMVEQNIAKKLPSSMRLNPSKFILQKERLCSKIVLLGTPAVIKAKQSPLSNKKFHVYSFVLFPEELNLKNNKNFVGIRIFPLPSKTLNSFFKYTKLKNAKVALITGKKTEKIARAYVENDPRFEIITIENDIGEVFDKLHKFKYIYLFPDPVVIKVSNLLKLLDFTSLKGIITISNFPETEKFGVNFIYGVDYTRLSELIVSLINTRKSCTSIIECPARVYVWKK